MLQSMAELKVNKTLGEKQTTYIQSQKKFIKQYGQNNFA